LLRARHHLAVRLEFMERLAVFEASARRLLPPEYPSMTPEEMDTRLPLLCAAVVAQ
jgi:hypothetical protein